jgi:ribonuclease D
VTYSADIITQPAELDDLIESLHNEPRLSLDVELDGFYNYSESVCVVTLSIPGRDYVLDSMALGAHTRVLERLTSRTGTPLLMHSGQNDVLALKRAYRMDFGMVHDTSVAAMLLDLPQTGLAALVEAYLGVTLEKGLQRHDWSRRPIEPEHVRYLVNDTRHLFRLHDLMWDELRKHELTEEYLIECRAVALSEPRPREFDPERFRRIKGHGQLTDRERGALKAVYAWRNNVARASDKAPFRVIGDHVLLELARQKPQTVDALKDIRGIGDWIVAQHADELLEAVRRGLSEPAPVRPPRTVPTDPPQRMDARQRDLLGRLKRWREEERNSRGVGLQAILPTAVLQDIILNPPDNLDELAENPRIGQARAERYGKSILKIVQDQ